MGRVNSGVLGADGPYGLRLPKGVDWELQGQKSAPRLLCSPRRAPFPSNQWTVHIRVQAEAQGPGPLSQRSSQVTCRSPIACVARPGVDPGVSAPELILQAWCGCLVSGLSSCSCPPQRP